MLARIPDSVRSKVIIGALALCAVGAFSSCATKEQPPLVADQAAKRDSTIPWNKQEKWETDGQYANMTDRR